MISETYNMDCMEYMRQFPDKHFELAVVDPPYAVGAADGTFGGRTGHNYKNHGSKTAKLKAYANANKVPEQEYFEELFRVSKNQIVWGFNYYPQYFSHGGVIIWDKETTGPLSDAELAWNSCVKLVEKYNHAWSGFKKGVETGLTRIHPNQKPIALYRWTLHKYAKSGDKILDTHLGSGSSRIAAYDLGFDFYATELDKDYFDAQEKRFQNFKSQLKLEFA